jgi:hypothetical protein
MFFRLVVLVLICAGVNATNKSISHQFGLIKNHQDGSKFDDLWGGLKINFDFINF